jgi:flagellar motor switch protein FliM
VIQTEANPQLMQIVPPNEVVILICFEIKVGESSGMLNLCVPFPVIEPIMGRFSTIQTWFTTKKSQSEAQDKDNLNAGVFRSPLDVVVYLANARISVRQFMNLKPGDLIATRKDIRSPLLMTVAGKAKFEGHAGRFRTNKALRITRNIPPGEEILF